MISEMLEFFLLLPSFVYFVSDYLLSLIILGCWTREGELEKRLPVGKAICVKLGDSMAQTKEATCN